jgi:hypothetical protein
MTHDPFIAVIHHRFRQPFPEIHHHRWVKRRRILERFQANKELSSHPEELPPEVLTEPDVTLSRHPALVTQPLRDQESANGQITVDSAERFCSTAAGFVHGVRVDACASDAATIPAARQNNETAYSTSPSDKSDHSTATSPAGPDSAFWPRHPTASENDGAISTLEYDPSSFSRIKSLPLAQT